MLINLPKVGNFNMKTKISFRLSTKQIVQMALFLAALMCVEISCLVAVGATWLWFAFDWYYGVAVVTVYILCARVTGLRFAVLLLGTCEALIGLVFCASFGGPIFVLYPFSKALVLQLVFWASRTNGESLKFNMIVRNYHPFELTLDNHSSHCQRDCFFFGNQGLSPF